MSGMENARLAKCPRCDKLFSKISFPVCPECQDAEATDMERIFEVLATSPNMGIDNLAAKANVTVQCIRRMLDQGRLSAGNVNEEVKCGRCGKPAISKSKRLCQACLSKLDQEWAETMREMRDTLIKGPKPLSVHETVTQKREGLDAPKAPEDYTAEELRRQRMAMAHKRNKRS